MREWCYNKHGDFMNKTLAIDLDGTLFYPKKRRTMIPKKNLLFLQDFLSAGGRVVIVTGRNYNFAKRVMEKVGHSMDVIGCNGAMIYADGKMVDENAINPQVFEKCYKDLKDLFHFDNWIMMTRDVNMVLSIPNYLPFRKLLYRLVYASQGIYAEKFEINSQKFDHEMKQGKIYKVMIFFGLGKKGKQKACEATKMIREKFPEIEASWSDNFIELTAAVANKANGLKKYCDIVGIDHESLVVAGDSGNDIAMFKEFHENSFCMSHASPKIQKYAAHVIDMVADLEPYLKK